MASDLSRPRGALLRRDAAELFLRRDDSHRRAQGIHRFDPKPQRRSAAQNFFAGGHDRFFFAGRGASRIGPLENAKENQVYLENLPYPLFQRGIIYREVAHYTV